MEKDTKHNLITKQEALKRMYSRTVCQNQTPKRKSCIKCPQCGQEILIVLPMQLMNKAIENHVQIHKAKRQSTILRHSTSINVRLALARQILEGIG
jgi:hypothetical protein